MFGLIADLLSTIITLLFPIFASYRALSTSSPAQTNPWLMYWVVLGILTFIESWTSWLLAWFPFYSWLRLGLHLWLVLPQFQGARLVYQEHVHPFLSRHENDIDAFISQAHDRARKVGLQYLNQAIEFVKESVLGIPPKRVAPAPSGGFGGSYAQSLLARFNLPSAADRAPAGMGDFYGLLASALGQNTGSSTGGSRSREAQVEDLSASGALIPPGIQDKEDRMSYIATQRERLALLMKALDREASNLAIPSFTGASARETESVPASHMDLDAVTAEPIGRSKSEVSFDKVEHDDAVVVEKPCQTRTASSGWMPWNWKGAEGTAGASRSLQNDKAVTSGSDAQT